MLDPDNHRCFLRMKARKDGTPFSMEFSNRSGQNVQYFFTKEEFEVLKALINGDQSEYQIAVPYIR